MKHLQIFNSHANFENATMDEPWVAYDGEHVHYSGGIEEDPVEFVDLGLPSGLLWASCNVGATKPEEYGKYFQWGDTVGYEGDEAKAHSTWSTAPFNNGSSSYDSDYFESVKDTVCPNGVLASAYDAATAAYGEGYRMPTEAEMNELIANTTSAWFASGNAEFNGVEGRKFTSKTNNSKYIFIPAVGYCNFGSVGSVGFDGYVWSSSLYTSYPSGAWQLSFSGSGMMPVSTLNRYQGFSVRAVKPKQ